MSIFIQFVIYLFAGFAEMCLATHRTLFITKEKPVQASAIVFIENALFFIILVKLLNNLNTNWPILVAYCIGGALGTFINIRHTVS